MVPKPNDDGNTQQDKPLGGLDTAKILDLDPRAYPGGIAIWGALPPVYNTSCCPPDSGVHVHARLKPGGLKCIDETFDIVLVHYGDASSFKITGKDAASYNISTILGLRLKSFPCPQCGEIHSDHEERAVRYHTDYVCGQCGAIAEDNELSVSNPAMLLKDLCGDIKPDRPINDPSGRKIAVHQLQYSGGVQIWGSNPAILWTSPKLEEGGIHFHGFVHKNTVPTVDETFGMLSLDGSLLDPQMVRVLMAQQSLEYLIPYLATLRCPACGHAHFEALGDCATPHQDHSCESCSHIFRSETPLVSNPLIEQLGCF